MRTRNTLIHKVIYNCPAPKPVLEVLLRVFPESVAMSDHAGWLPLHAALQTNKDGETLKLLVRSYPKALAVKHTSTSGVSKEFPLHVALRSHCDADVIAEFLQNQETDSWSTDGHYCPDGVLAETGCEPVINTAVASNDGVEIVRLLLSARAQAGTRCRTTGFSALESVLVSSHVEELFDTVFNAVQDEGCSWAVTKNIFGTPLHVALKHRVPLRIITQLVDSDPSALTVQDFAGRMPIHVAAMNVTHASLLVILAKWRPKTLHAVSTHHWTPLQLAVQHRPCAGAIQDVSLFDTTGSLFRVLDFRGRSLLALAIAVDAPVRVIQELFAAMPQRLPNVLELRERPNGAMCEAIRLAQRPPVPRHPDVVSAVTVEEQEVPPLNVVTDSQVYREMRPRPKRLIGKKVPEDGFFKKVVVAFSSVFLPFGLA